MTKYLLISLLIVIICWISILIDKEFKENAPLKYKSGKLLTSPAPCSFECVGKDCYFTDKDGNRKNVIELIKIEDEK